MFSALKDWLASFGEVAAANRKLAGTILEADANVREKLGMDQPAQIEHREERKARK